MKKIFVLFILVIITHLVFSSEAKLLRFPATNGKQVAFSYGGNIFLVDIEGGEARRLTSHKDYEFFPRFSPDGKTIAFSARYDGNTEVYTIPVSGGIPKRLTYTATLSRDDISDRMGPNNIVMTWTNDGENVVYRSRKRSFNSFKGHLYLAPVNGGLSKQIALATGSWCSFSPDGKKLAMNRVFREFRTWKYYRGGMADDIWIHDFETKKTINVTNNESQDIFPMWYKDKIFFLSDRDRVMNLFEYDVNTRVIQKRTNFTGFDIKFPSIGGDFIVFENGGFIYKYCLKENFTSKMTIQIKEDFSYSMNRHIDASDFITSVSIAPDGSRVVVSARGEIFSVPVEKGITRQLTNNSFAHNRNAVWSPDGKYIAYLSDKSSEYQIYIQDPQTPGSEIKISNLDPNYIYNLKWSPDSKMLLWNDKKLGLHYIDIDKKRSTQIHTSEIWEIHDYNWSPDSKWVVYSDRNKARFSITYLYNLKTKQSHRITSGWYQSYNPVFSNDGKYLFFVSNRDFNPIYSITEWNIAYRDMSRIYFVTLDDKTKSPLSPRNTEVFDNNNNEETPEGTDVKISIEGIMDRIDVIPGNAGTYSNLSYANNRLYYVYNKLNHSPKLKMYDFGKDETVELGNFSAFQISSDNKKMLLRKGKDYFVIDLPVSKISTKNPVCMNDLKIWVDLKAEWHQIYDEAWRQMRDFFYDPGMHGVNWENIRSKYRELVKYVNNRNDLNYIIGEMIGELNAGHAYINDGDRTETERIQTGLLGAELSLDEQSGYYRIDKILSGKNWKHNVRSPLTGPGIDINEGEYIISINNISVKSVDNIYSLLVGKAGKLVEITINSSPRERNARSYVIKPIADESQLYYFNWVQENMRKVAVATNGQVGYIHIPDMSVTGLNEFVKHFYPQLAKRALIIDDRGNGGGNVSTMLIERLKRELSIMVMSRDVPVPDMKPSGMFFGPKVLLVDQYSASDGDLFPYQFKRHKLGFTIGTRTWGGVIGIRGSLPFVDGADLRKPEFAHYDETGWILEGKGFIPDIIVDNDPYLEFMGQDQQLEKAIEVIMNELSRFDKQIPPIPEFPNKTR